MSIKVIESPDLPEEDVSQAYRTYTLNRQQYYLIDSTFLVPGHKVTFRIFALYGQKLKILSDGSVSNPAGIDDKIHTEKGDFLIKDDDISHYQNYLLSFREDKSRLPLLVREQSKMVMKDIFENPASRPNIIAVQNMAVDLVNNVMEGQDVIYNLLTLKKHDYYSYLHSVNVAVLAIGLGKTIGLTPEEIGHLGVGALLHDIGKTALPDNIINKLGELTSEEFQIYKNHVALGTKIVRDIGEIPQEALTVIDEHHEKLTGKGYPRGLKDGEIHPLGRIAAIADCYDYLTTPRPNKYSLDPFRALKVIASDKDDYDRTFLAAFVKMLGKIKPEA